MSVRVAVGVWHELHLGRSRVEAERSSAVGVAARVAQLGVTSSRRSWGDGAVVSVSVVAEQVGAVVVAAGDLVVVARTRAVGMVVVVFIVIVIMVIVIVVMVVSGSRAQSLRTSGSLSYKLNLVASNHTEGVGAVGVTRGVRRRGICGGGWSWSHQTVVSILVVAKVVGAVEMAASDGGSGRNTRKEGNLSEQHGARVRGNLAMRAESPVFISTSGFSIN